MSTDKKDQVEELSDEQIQSVSAAGAPRKGVLACSSPNGDFTARKGVVACASPSGDVKARTRTGVHACTSPDGD